MEYRPWDGSNESRISSIASVDLKTMTWWLDFRIWSSVGKKSLRFLRMEYFISIFGSCANCLRHYPLENSHFEFVYCWSSGSAPFTFCFAAWCHQFIANVFEVNDICTAVIVYACKFGISSHILAVPPRCIFFRIKSGLLLSLPLVLWLRFSKETFNNVRSYGNEFYLLCYKAILLCRSVVALSWKLWYGCKTLWRLSPL